MKANKFCFILVIAIAFLTGSNGCKKTTEIAPTPPDPVLPTEFTVDNKWECTVDGINYKGTIDTSFYQVINTQISNPDTVVDCNGTSDDKRANIHFRIIFNRTARPGPIYTSYSNGLLVFDTTSKRFLISSSDYNNTNVIYKIDTLISNKLKASFDGQLILPLDGGLNGGSIHNISNGKFSCAFGVGDKEPKSFSFRSDPYQFSGYFLSAALISNTLIMDGLPYTYFGEKSFKLFIKTGGTIKTGTYQSKNGEVGLQFYSPSVYPFYINDSLGSLTVNITSVNGNVVRGNFVGTNEDKKVIEGGEFSCRVKNYIPQADSLSKWSFGTDESIFLYNIYGGNILDATKSKIANKYFLTLIGESDKGDSKFKLVVSSISPIGPGIYQTGYYNNRLDSLYFKSNQKIWNGNTTYLYSDDYSNTYCKIDSIDSHKVVGTLYGRIDIFLSSNGFTGSELKNGKFRATF